MTDIKELTTVQKSAILHRLSRLIAYAPDDELREMAVEVEQYMERLIEALEAKDAECKRLSDELRGATALLTLMKIDAREIVREAEAKDARIAELEQESRNWRTSFDNERFRADKLWKELQSRSDAQVITVSLPQRYELEEMSNNPFESYRCLEPDSYGDYVRVDDVVDVLAAAGIQIREPE
ncbi:hypothetical protein ACRS85_21635 [Pluralibacter gergoviae]|uniref:hypothetical protein n=1 Tax=Pluralibacter gergoviae TaxID=61647 RepID=UPI003EE2B766